MVMTVPLVEEVGKGIFRVPGFSQEQLSAAIALLQEAQSIQAEETAARRGELLKAMMLSGIPPVPRAAIEQARRLAEHRERLLASGAFTTATLQQLRGDKSQQATRTWISRRRHVNALFTVEHDGVTLIPAFQIRPDGITRRGIAPALGILKEAGMGGWELWTWFTARTSWLSDRSPESLMDERPSMVAEAARAVASNLARP
ncbi:MAG TPA: hypothetical protein VGS21_10310 [Acidimicrobiales bacterium]|nr:hypothetical protein [Acidimicrobiales bacterium]